MVAGCVRHPPGDPVDRWWEVPVEGSNTRRVPPLCCRKRQGHHCLWIWCQQDLHLLWPWLHGVKYDNLHIPNWQTLLLRLPGMHRSPVIFIQEKCTLFVHITWISIEFLILVWIVLIPIYFPQCIPWILQECGKDPETCDIQPGQRHLWLYRQWLHW